MKKTVPSNLALSVAILIVGVSALIVTVWLSPAPNDGASSIRGISATPLQIPPATDHGQGSKPMGADPFAEKLGAPDGVNPSKAAGMPLVTRESTIPLGVDPFKQKLLEQSKQAISSPFAPPETKP
jgi:hypothetical protein